MNQFKIGDRVRTVKDCNFNQFKKGQIGSVFEIYDKSMIVDFDYYRLHIAYIDEIELIESEKDDPKPFPTFEEFNTWYLETEPIKSKGECKWTQQVYNYFAEFKIQPSRLEQLKARRSELSREELLELVELIEGNYGRN